MSEGAGRRSWLERIAHAVSGEPQDRAELVALLRDAESRALLDADALTMVEGVLQVGEMHVRDIMVPRAQMVVVRGAERPESFVKGVVESGHSRFPVVGDSRDDVEGILLAKDLIGYFAVSGRPELDLEDVMRPAVFIPESKRLNVLLREFRESRNHMAIVVDEYGGVAGLVTIEDVLEQIVGEIDDEHDQSEERYIRRLDAGDYTVKALTPLEDFNDYFDTDFSEEAFDTVGGLVVNAFGHLPARGEACRVGPLSFRVLRADKRRVHLLSVRVDGKIAAGEGG